MTDNFGEAVAMTLALMFLTPAICAAMHIGWSRLTDKFHVWDDFITMYGGWFIGWFALLIVGIMIYGTLGWIGAGLRLMGVV